MDASHISDGNMLTRMFSSVEARVRRFAERFEVVSSQIDTISIDLDRHKDQLRRDIALLDQLHDQTKTAIQDLDAHIEAGKEFGNDFRTSKLPALKTEADAKSGGSDAMLAAQGCQDASQALKRLEKRLF